MRNGVSALIACALLLAFSSAAGADASAAEERQYTIVYKSHNSLPADAEGAISAAGGSLVLALPEVGVAVASSASPTFASDLSAHSSVADVGAHGWHSLPELVVPEATTPPDALWARQWSMRRVKANLAWDVTMGSRDSVVSVIDTGVASNHPDLGPNIVYMACYSVAPTCNPYPDRHWHGTHVAGLAAANFGGGTIGVGPQLGIASYNVFEQIPGCGICAYDAPIWAAMIDSAQRGWDVINMSLGGYDDFSNGRSAATAWTAWNRVANYVTNLGTTIVASSGNGDVDLNGSLYHLPSDLQQVISVGATGIYPLPEYPPGQDRRAFYSNYGRSSIELVAPGGDCGQESECNRATRPPNWFEYLVLSTYVATNPVCAAAFNCPVRWAWAGGTSMASPHVAGTAGLIRSVDPGASPEQVESILKRTAEQIGNKQLYGHGMVDAHAAVLEAGR